MPEISMDAFRPTRGLPVYPASIPPLPRLPGIGAAVAAIAVYFALQLVMANLLVLLLALGVGLDQGTHSYAGMQAIIATLLTNADNRAWLVLGTLGTAAPLTLWLVWRHWRAIWPLALPPGLGLAPARPAFLLLGLIVGIALPLVGGMLTQWLAHGHQVTQDIKQLGDGSSPPLRLLLAMLVVTLGPLVEEVLFRGLLLSALLHRLGRGRAIALSALAFGLVHLPDLNYLWYAVPNLVLLGVALAWLRLRAASLWPAVLAHGVNNLIAVLVWFGASATHSV
jgi:membrane protease YdiL (CAAX protease family)